MANRELHRKAIELREKHMSYSQIKSELGISKSTLSVWLRDYPLTRERINELRGWSERRIERTRETKARKKAKRLEKVYEQVSKDIGTFSEREIFLCGLFLFWGEGGKTQYSRTTLSNTDPAMLRFFMKWLTLRGADMDRLKVHVHLYNDMDIESELEYWSQTLDIPRSSFRKPYIKLSKRSDVTYAQKFIHGTCNVIYENRDLGEYISAALEVIRTSFADSLTV